MTMKRRSFLSMLGAAVAAPAMPALSATSAGGSQAAFKVAVAHAQKFPVISVGGLAKRGGFSTVQADALIKELSSKGMVKLVGPSRSGGVRAASKIMINDPWGIARVAKSRPTAPTQAQARGTSDHRASISSKSDLMMVHLRKLCRARGIMPQPRSYAVRMVA